MISDIQWERALAIAQKEVYHILRDPFTLAMALVIPVFLVTWFGFAIEFNINDISLAVYDGDQTQSSRVLIETFTSSHYFHAKPVNSPQEALRFIDGEKAKAALIIEPDFERNLRSLNEGRVQVVVDGADNSTVGSVMGYIATIQKRASERIMNIKIPEPLKLVTQFHYNPELSTRWFIVPSLGVVAMAILSVLLTALTVAREWENGSMELLLSTPAQPIEIIIGKLAPYTAMGLGAIVFVYLVARIGFGVPFVGNHFVFLIGTLLFLLAYLAQGLLISVLTRKQQLSMQFSILSGLLPSLLLSGFIFPIEHMPRGFQWFTAILPARWYMVITRDVYLKGSGFYDLRVPFFALTLISVVLMFLATRKFKKDLEP